LPLKKSLVLGSSWSYSFCVLAAFLVVGLFDIFSICEGVILTPWMNEKACKHA